MSCIVGGVDAAPVRYGYTVSLQSTTTLRRECGCVMIAPGVALTAARCALFPCASASLTILTRPCRLSSPHDGSEIFPIARIRVHPDYSETAFENDIAVILLDGTTAVDQPLLRISEDPPPLEGQFPHADGLGRDGPGLVLL